VISQVRNFCFSCLWLCELHRLINGSQSLMQQWWQWGHQQKVTSETSCLPQEIHDVNDILLALPVNAKVPFPHSYKCWKLKQPMQDASHSPVQHGERLGCVHRRQRYRRSPRRAPRAWRGGAASLPTSSAPMPSCCFSSLLLLLGVIGMLQFSLQC